MTGTADRDHFGSADDEGGLDPREAARLLDQTTRDVRRRLDYRSPALSVIGAIVVVLAFGAVWLSVRHQHPYKGPTAVGLLVMYGVLVCWWGVVGTVIRRAGRGVSGRSVRQQRAQAAVLVTALVAVSVLQGLLKADGVSNAIAYGVFPPTAQLIVLGTVGATIMASREDWIAFGSSLGVIAAAAGSAIAGPRGVWLSDGITLLGVIALTALAQAWQVWYVRSQA